MKNHTIFTVVAFYCVVVTHIIMVPYLIFVRLNAVLAAKQPISISKDEQITVSL